MVDANKTLSTDEELKMCCRSIVEDFPALKIEELRACFDMIIQGKFGKLYERLKTADILECLRRYEGEVRAPILERYIHNSKHDKLKWETKHIEVVKGVVDEIKVTDPVKPKGSGLGQRVKKKLGTD